jgi:hypothetical protein
MSVRPNLPRAFTFFRIVLGVSLLYGSITTAVHGGHNLGGGHDGEHLHMLLLGGIEAIGALLLLVPRFVQAGAALLLATIAWAFVIHSFRGEVRPDLLVYLAGVVLVWSYEQSRSARNL